MSNPESIIVEHYKTVRDEELERIRQRDKYVTQFVMGTGVIGGVVIADDKWWGLLLIIPIFAAAMSFLYAHTDITLGSLSKWLRDHYSKMIDDYREDNKIKYSMDNWDASDSQTNYVKGLTFAMRYFAVAILYSGLAILSVLIISQLDTDIIENTVIDESSKNVIIVLWVLSAFSFLSPIYAWIVRIFQNASKK